MGTQVIYEIEQLTMRIRNAKGQLYEAKIEAPVAIDSPEDLMYWVREKETEELSFLDRVFKEPEKFLRVRIEGRFNRAENTGGPLLTVRLVEE